MKKVFVVLFVLCILSSLYATGLAEKLSLSDLYSVAESINENGEYNDFVDVSSDEGIVLSQIISGKDTKETEDGSLPPFYNGVYSHHTLTCDYSLSLKKAQFTYPEGVDAFDILDFVDYLLSKNASPNSVTYSIREDAFVVEYSKMDESEIKDYVSQILEKADEYIDENFVNKETTLDNPVDYIEEPFIKRFFDYKGIQTTISAYPEYMYISFCGAFNKIDVESLNAYLIDNGYAFLSSYYIVGDDVVFTYDETDEKTLSDEIDLFVEAFKAYIDFTKTVDEEANPFSFRLDLGVRGKYRYFTGSTPLYPKVSANINLSYSFFFTQAGVEGMIYKNYDKVYIVGSLSASSGLKMRTKMCDIFGYLSARYTYSSPKSDFSSGFVLAAGGGLEFNLTKDLIFSASYEYLDKKHYYSVVLGRRF